MSQFETLHRRRDPSRFLAMKNKPLQSVSSAARRLGLGCLLWVAFGTGPATSQTAETPPRPATPSAESAASAPESKTPGDRPLRILLRSEVEIPDPQERAWNVVDSLFAGVYDRLLRTEPDGTLAPNLATSWDFTDDLTVRFELRRDVRFHDGSTFDAHDVVASYDRARNIKNGDLKSRLVTIASYRAVEAHLLEVKTHHVDPLLLRRLVMIPILPAGTPYPLERHVGTGPYRWAGQTAPGTVRLIARDDPWRPAAREPEVEIGLTPDTDERLARLQAGEVDLAPAEPAMAKKAEKDESLWIFSQISPGVFFVGLNTAQPPLDDVRIRQAVHLALDRAAIAEALANYARPAAQLVGPGSFGYRPGSAAPLQNVEAAKALLKQAGHESVELGNLTIVSGREEVGNAIQHQLAQAGLKIHLKIVSFQDLVATMGRGDTSLYVIGWSNPTLDLGDVLEQLAYTNEPRTRRGLANETRYSDPKIDRLIDLADSTRDPEKRLDAITHAEARVADAAYVLPLIWEMTLWVGSSDLEWQPRVDYIVNPYEMFRRSRRAKE